MTNMYMVDLELPAQLSQNNENWPGNAHRSCQIQQNNNCVSHRRSLQNNSTVDKYVHLKDYCPCERHAENSIAFFCEEP
jgi:hypothetical protein